MPKGVKQFISLYNVKMSSILNEFYNNNNKYIHIISKISPIIDKK